MIVGGESGKRGEGVIVCGVFIELRSDMGFVMALEHWRLLMGGISNENRRCSKPKCGSRKEKVGTPNMLIVENLLAQKWAETTSFIKVERAGLRLLT